MQDLGYFKMLFKTEYFEKSETFFQLLVNYTQIKNELLLTLTKVTIISKYTEAFCFLKGLNLSKQA